MAEKNSTIILIGGAPTTGKSTVAKALSERLGLPWISSDTIRSIMRTASNPKDAPALFHTNGYNAERFLTEFTAEQIATMELEQGEAVWPGIVRLTEGDCTWEDGFIVEGVNILPHLVARDLKDRADVHAVFLVDEDADRMRDVVFKRGLWGDAHTYSDDVKEKEVEWATLFSHKLKAEVEQYGYPWVEVSKGEDDDSAVLNALGLES